MAHEASWPPHSPHAALLSSPSGRKKYEAMQTSPLKRSNTTPNLLGRLRAARGEKNVSMENDDDNDDEDDEEILELKLAAIEAKLKLKKLQQSKSRAPTPARPHSRPTSSHGTIPSKLNRGQWHEQSTDSLDSVEIPLSPVRRTQPTIQPKSPSRILLGIDKGVRAADVSLKRANTTSNTSYRSRMTLTSTNERPSSRSSAFNSARSATSTTSTNEGERRKPFSERMAEARQNEVNLSSRREAMARNRSKGFAVDHAELESYRSASESSNIPNPQRSPTSLSRHVEYSREEVLHSVGQTSSGTRPLKRSRTMPNLRESPSRPISAGGLNHDPPQGDSSLYEGFSQLHLSSRILPHSFLKRTLPSDQFTTYRIPDLLREVKAPGYELPEEVCDYVIFGVVGSKSGAMDHKTLAPDDKTVSTKDWQRKWEDGSQNHRRFMAITLTDLTWSVDLYLFGTALPRYHRISPGTVVAILNPGIMPPKPGREDTGAFSLSLSGGDDTVLEIGTSRDLGFCKTPKKDGKECGSWVDTSKTSICEWHLNAELAKAQSGRMGVNSGSNGFGSNGLGGGGGGGGGRNYFERGRGAGCGGGRGLKAEGKQWDRATQSNYFISRSNVTGSKPESNDPRFSHSVPLDNQDHLDRNKDERIRRRFAAREKEREIAAKLGGLSGSNMGFGGAGAEYLRQQAQKPIQEPSRHNRKKGKCSTPTSSTNASTTTTFQSGAQEKVSTKRSALTTRSNLLSYTVSSTSNGKRRAENVRLSPVKKTRFVTEKGIREAGRDSLGGVDNLGGGGDSDDDLEIV